MYREKLKMKNTHVGADDPVCPHFEGIPENVGGDAHIDPHYKGITLIALVITIIVLLILAGVAITLAIDSDGLFSRANQAGKEWNNAVTNEEAELGSLMQMLNIIGGSDTAGGDGDGEETPDTTSPTAPTAIEEVTNTENAVEVKATGGTDSESGVVGYKYSIDKTTWSETIAENENYTIEYAQTSTTELPSNWESSKVTTVAQDGTQIAPVPVGYSISGSSEENSISQGLVIYESNERVIPTIYAKTVDEAGNESEVFTLDNRETINQYVWIPVDDINDMIMCKSNASGSICTIEVQVDESLKCTKHSSTDLCGRWYSTDEDGKTSMTFDETAKASQTWHEYGYREPDILTDTSVADGVDSYLTGIGITVPEDAEEGTTVQDVFKGQLTDVFLAMAKSVEKYKGFYISRYEVGENGASKKNQLVLTAVDDVANAGTSNGRNPENVLAGNMWYGLYNTLRNETGVDTSVVNTHMVWRKYV